MQTTLTNILGREMLGTDSAYSVLQGIFIRCMTTPELCAASSYQIYLVTNDVRQMRDIRVFPAGAQCPEDICRKSNQHLSDMNAG